MPMHGPRRRTAVALAVVSVMGLALCRAVAVAHTAAARRGQWTLPPNPREGDPTEPPQRAPQRATGNRCWASDSRRSAGALYVRRPTGGSADPSVSGSSRRHSVNTNRSLAPGMEWQHAGPDLPHIPVARAVLTELYRATCGYTWTHRTRWLGLWSVCLWDGVSCNNDLTAVVGLGLNNNHLVGTIPDSLSRLAQLQYIVFNGNQLTGTVPESLGNLAQLYQLDLGGNELTGTIPKSIGNQPKLRQLNLGDNQLNGTMPDNLGNLTQLRELNLGDNQLTGTIPDYLGNLAHLQELHLGDNHLTGTVPASLGNLVQLQELHLGDNQLTGTMPDSLGNLSHLNLMYLANAQLTGSIPDSFGNLTQLQQLHLEGNNLNGTIPASLGNLVQLRELGLLDNQLTGTIPESLGNLTQLQELHAGGNCLNGTIPASLGSLTRMQQLGLLNNKLTGTIPDSLGNLAQLQELSLGRNALTGSIPESIGNLPQLGGLNLRNNSLCGEAPVWLCYRRALFRDAASFNALLPPVEQPQCELGQQRRAPPHLRACRTIPGPPTDLTVTCPGPTTHVPVVSWVPPVYQLPRVVNYTVAAACSSTGSAGGVCSRCPTTTLHVSAVPHANQGSSQVAWTCTGVQYTITVVASNTIGAGLPKTTVATSACTGASPGTPTLPPSVVWFPVNVSGSSGSEFMAVEGSPAQHLSVAWSAPAVTFPAATSATATCHLVPAAEHGVVPRGIRTGVSTSLCPGPTPVVTVTCSTMCPPPTAATFGVNSSVLGARIMVSVVMTNELGTGAAAWSCGVRRVGDV